jgi:hypothetical protein
LKFKKQHTTSNITNCDIQLDIWVWVESKKKGPSSVWIILENSFLNFEKSPWEHNISKNSLKI